MRTSLMQLLAAATRQDPPHAAVVRAIERLAGNLPRGSVQRLFARLSEAWAAGEKFAVRAENERSLQAARMTDEPLQTICDSVARVSLRDAMAELSVDLRKLADILEAAMEDAAGEVDDDPPSDLDAALRRAMPHAAMRAVPLSPEAAIVAIALAEPALLDSTRLRAEDFHDDELAEAFGCALALRLTGRDVSPWTVFAAIEEQQGKVEGGAARLAELLTHAHRQTSEQRREYLRIFEAAALGEYARDQLST